MIPNQETIKMFVIDSPKIYESLLITITRKIRKAKNRVIIASAWFTNKNMIESIILSHGEKKKKLDVKVLLDGSTKDNLITSALLRRNDIDVKLISGKNNKLIMHHKFVITDNESFVGSMNFTEASRFQYNTVFFVNGHNTIKLVKHFNSMWNYKRR